MLLSGSADSVLSGLVSKRFIRYMYLESTLCAYVKKACSQECQSGKPLMGVFLLY